MHNVSKLILAHVAGNLPVEYSDFTQDQKEEAVRSVFLKEIGLEGAYSAKAFRRAFNGNKEKIYQIVEEVIGNGVHGLDRHPFFNQFVQHRDLELGQSSSFVIKTKNSVIVSEAAANFSMKRQRVENGYSVQVLPRVYNVSIYDFCDRIASGQSNFAEMIDAVREAIKSKLEEICHTALAASLASLPAGFVANGSYDEGAIMDVIEKVESINEKTAILVGPKSALAKLQNRTTVGLSEAQKDEKAKYGFVKEWNGTLCIALDNIAKTGTHELLLANDEIIVMATDSKPVLLTTEGTEINREISGVNTQDNTLTLQFAVRAGVAVAHADVVGRITIA